MQIVGRRAPFPYDTKVNGEVLPRRGSEGPEGSRNIALTLSLTTALDVGGWFTPCPDRFTPGKRPGTYCTRAWVGPRAGLVVHHQLIGFRKPEEVMNILNQQNILIKIQ
jgi:hypothetical protein